MLFNAFENAVPPRPIIPAKPYKRSLSYNMRFGNKPPKTTILAAVAIIAHHPIIIILKCIRISGLSVDDIAAIAFFDGPHGFSFANNRAFKFSMSGGATW